MQILFVYKNLVLNGSTYLRFEGEFINVIKNIYAKLAAILSIEQI